MKLYIFVLFLSSLFFQTLLAGHLDDYLVATELKKVLKDIPSTSYTMIMQQKASYPPGVAEKMATSLSKAFEGDDMFGILKKKLKKAKKDSFYKVAAEFAKSPFGKKTTKAEVEANTPKGAKALHAFMQQLDKKVPPQDRIRLIAEIMKVGGAIEMSQLNAKRSNLQVALGLNAAAPKKDRKSTLEVIKMASLNEPKLLQMAAQQMVVVGIYIYKDFSMQELKKYLAHLSKPEMTKITEVVVKEFDQTIEESTKDYPKILEKAFKK